MKTMNVVCVCLAGVAVSGCGKGERGPGFDIAVAPLELADVTDACYRVTVTNGPGRSGEIVWQQDAVCADRYGNGFGAISYVGSCDADADGPNSVTIELLDLSTGQPAQPMSDATYVNPCGQIADWDGDRDALVAGEDAGPCTIDKVCEENADVAVTFDLTIMRDAMQGFFDFAVNFDDVFCSAKLDCSEGLLHDAAGERGATAIVGFACSAGGNQVTRMHVSDLTLSCDVDSDPETPAPYVYTLANSDAVGQHGAVTTSGGAAGVFQWATYEGDEQLGVPGPGVVEFISGTCVDEGQPTSHCVYPPGTPALDTLPTGPCTSNPRGSEYGEVRCLGFVSTEDEPFAKCFVNRAVGIDTAALGDLGVTSCTLSGIGTATDGDLNLGAAGSWYPVVEWEVEVYSRDPSGEVSLCDNNALDDPGSGVRTRYVSAESAPLRPFTDEKVCALPATIECAAGAPVRFGNLGVEVEQVGDVLTVTTGDQATTVSLTGALAGFKLGGGCHQDVCCQE